MRLIYPGNEAFKEAIKQIDLAKTSIEIQMFIWRDDKIGNLLLDALILAAKRNVQIHIKKDRFGSIFEKSEENKQSMFHKKRSLYTSMLAYLIDHMYSDYRKPRGYKQLHNPKVDQLLSYPNVILETNILKDHTKYYIFDNETLLIGGVNVEDKEDHQDIQGRSYRDYMVLVEDKNVIKHFKQRLEGLPYNNNLAVEFITNKFRKEAKQILPELILEAKDQVIMHMAYFGAKKATKAIVSTLKKGVKVEIITSEVSNLQNDYNRKILKKFYNHGAKIYLHKGLIHAKALRIDDQTIIGSTNLNKAAFDKLGECSIIVKNNVLSKSFLEAHQVLVSESLMVTDIKQLNYKSITAFFEMLAS